MAIIEQVTYIFVEVDDISEVFPQCYHCYYWEKGFKVGEKHWKAYFYGDHKDYPEGIGLGG